MLPKKGTCTVFGVRSVEAFFDPPPKGSLTGGGILCTQGPWIMQCTIMHNYARLCGLHCNEDTQGLQTRGNLGLRSPTNRQHSEICSSHSCLFWSENQLALPHFQTVEEFYCPAKHLQQWKHVQVHFAGQNCP